MRTNRSLTMVCTATLACGCAAGTQPLGTAAPVERGCSFRAPTTCWTVSRYRPAPRPEPVTPRRDEFPEQPRAVLAALADSARLADPGDREVTP